MSKKFWLCIWFLFIPSILLHFSFPVTLDLFFLGFVDIYCYFVLLYPGLELQFCSSFSRFVFGSFWPLCLFSCVKSFHLCIWFGFILFWTEKNVTFVWFSFFVAYGLFCLLCGFVFLFILMSKKLFTFVFGSFLFPLFLCILLFRLLFTFFFLGFAKRLLLFCSPIQVSIFLHLSFSVTLYLFFLGIANVCCYFVLLSRFGTTILLFFFDCFHWPSLYLVPFDSLPICWFLKTSLITK